MLNKDHSQVGVDHSLKTDGLAIINRVEVILTEYKTKHNLNQTERRRAAQLLHDVQDYSLRLAESDSPAQTKNLLSKIMDLIAKYFLG